MTNSPPPRILCTRRWPPGCPPSVMTARQRCRQPSTRTSSERSADGFPEITTGGLVAENSTFPAPEYLMPCDSRFRGPLASADSLSIAVVSRNGTRPPLPAEIEWRLIRHPHEIGVRDQVLLFHGSGMAEEVGRFSAGSRGRVLPAVVLAPELDWGDVSRALSHGALSYLLENEYACLVTEALFCASAGTSILDPEIAAEQLRVARSARGGPNRCGCKEGEPTGCPSGRNHSLAENVRSWICSHPGHQSETSPRICSWRRRRFETILLAFT